MEASLNWRFFTEHLVSFIIPFSRWRVWSPFGNRGTHAASNMFEFGWWHIAAQNILLYFTALILAVTAPISAYDKAHDLLMQHHLLHVLSYCLAASVFLLVYSFRLAPVEDGVRATVSYSAETKARLKKWLQRHGPLRDFDIDRGSTAPEGKTLFKRKWLFSWIVTSHVCGLYPLVGWYLQPSLRHSVDSTLAGRIFALCDFFCHLCSAANISYILLLTFESLTLFYFSRVDLMKRLNKKLATKADLSPAFLKEWLDSRSLLRSFDRARWFGLESIAFLSLAFVVVIGGYLARLEYLNQLECSGLNIRLMIGLFLCGSTLYAMGKVAEMSDREQHHAEIILSRRRIAFALSDNPQAQAIDTRIRALKSFLRTDLHSTRLIALHILQIVKHLLGLAGLYSVGRIAQVLHRVMIMPLLQHIISLFGIRGL